MSLKAFHVVFIAVSILFCGFFALWAIDALVHGGGAVYAGYAAGGAAAGVGLAVYGPWMLKKLRNESYL